MVGQFIPRKPAIQEGGGITVPGVIVLVCITKLKYIAYSITKLKYIAYSITKLKYIAYSITKLKYIAYSITKLKYIAYSITKLKYIAYSITKLKYIAYSITKLKYIAYSITKLKYIAYSITKLKYIAYSITKLKYIAYSITKLKYIAYHITKLKYIAYHITKLKYIAYHITKLKYIAYHITKLKYIAYSITKLKYIAYSITKLKYIAYSITKLKYIAYHITKLKYIVYSITKLKYIAYHITKLKYIVYSITKLKYIAYSITKLKHIAYRITKLKYIAYSITKLKYIAYSITKLKYIAYSITKLKYIAYSITKLKYIAYSITKLKYIAYSITKLKYIVYSITKLKYIAYSITKLKHIAYRITKLKYIAYSITKLKHIAYRITKLKYIAYSITKLKHIAYRITKLKYIAYSRVTVFNDFLFTCRHILSNSRKVFTTQEDCVCFLWRGTYSHSYQADGNNLAVDKIVAGGNQTFVLYSRIEELEPSANIFPLKTGKRISSINDNLLDKWISECESKQWKNTKNNDKHFKTTTETSGMDLSLVRLAFEKLAKNTKVLMQVESVVLNKLLPSLSGAPAGVEALRIYLIITELIRVLKTEHSINEVASSLAEAILRLQPSSREILESLWSKIPIAFFKLVVMRYHLVSSRYLHRARTGSPVNLDKLENSLRVLQILYKVNSNAGNRIQENKFYISEIGLYFHSVKFVDENGIDHGGISQEFFSVITRELHALEPRVFKLYEDSRLVWFIQKEHRNSDMFFLIGVLCGMALYNHCVADFHFPLALFKKLLKEKPTLEDLKELSPIEARSLQAVLDEDEDSVESLYLDFTVQGHELVPNGKDILVTKYNRTQYVEEYVDFVFNKSVKKQFGDFMKGFRKGCPSMMWNTFLPVELMAILNGNTKYEWEELEKNANYKGYEPTDENIRNFWMVFHELDEERKKHFLELFGKASANISYVTKEGIWSSIVEKVNAVSVSRRTVNQCFVEHTWFHLIGVTCGLAIYNSTVVDLHFPLALFKKFLGVPPTLVDLKELSPTEGSSTICTAMAKCFASPRIKSSDRIPIYGMESLQIVIQPTSAGQQYLPVAHTCYNWLDLPKYQTKEILRRRLTQAIEQYEGFSLV
ncbi:UNVERIFIED_CONTAM: hypothetical protein FKN15_034935 [Acipenser sinensis]